MILLVCTNENVLARGPSEKVISSYRYVPIQPCYVMYVVTYHSVESASATARLKTRISQGLQAFIVAIAR